MCLGIPGKIVRWLEHDPIFALAEVEFDGIRREVHMACTPTALEGAYVIVHAGVAICQIDAQEAERVLAELKQLDLLEANTETDRTAADEGSI
ncbi:MAG: HypC/HybG/HupF family hydrogenase formation chaperone [Pirellulaceae bacterium]|nr:HypC/HybG/HupF family hydrogenase formation chaperone [Pirellulaceae bacterium]